MDIAGLGSSAVTADSQSSAFREADFLQIMLQELTNQDPLQPSETSKIVENMQKLQELANTQFGKFREDLQWAQGLIGQEVTANQANITEDEYDGLVDRGLRPDRGFGLVSGKVTNYRVMGENVWVTINDNDYPIDNVQSVKPELVDPQRYGGIADSMLGKKVQYLNSNLEPGEGVVERISWDQDGSVLVRVNGEELPFSRIMNISSDDSLLP